MNATYIVPLVGITLMVMGLCGVGVAAWRSHKVSSRLDVHSLAGHRRRALHRGGARGGTGADAAGQSHLRAGGPGLQGRALPAVPVERGRPGARRSAQGRAHRNDPCRGVRRRAGGFGHARLRARAGGAGERGRQPQDGSGRSLHPSHDRRTGTELVVASPHQGPATDGDRTTFPICSTSCAFRSRPASASSRRCRCRAPGSSRPCAMSCD